MYKKLNQLNKDVVDAFYAPAEPGILVIRDEFLSRPLLSFVKHIEHQEFSIKEYPHINQGQTYYHFAIPKEIETKSDFVIKTLVDIEYLIRSKVSGKNKKTILEYGFTRYPVSSQGATAHVDFSYNVNCTITFFFGKTTMNIAKTKEEKSGVEYVIEPGDIVVLRAPRSFEEKEVSLRPVHAVGAVEKELLAFEAREVDQERKQNIKKG